MYEGNSFNHDSSQEEILGGFLDKCYAKVEFDDNGTKKTFGEDITRITEDVLQKKGVDFVYLKRHGNVAREIYIDEKAQTTFINKNLPTFIFELSYKSNPQALYSKKGWYLDENKITDYYFLVTSIFIKKDLENKNLGYINERGEICLNNSGEVKSCIVTKVHSSNLEVFLNGIKITNPEKIDLLRKYEGEVLSKATCQQLADEFRSCVEHKNEHPLKMKLAKYISISYTVNRKEKPINLVINLDYIVKNVDKCNRRNF